jgi:anti-anti-sigma factor
MPGVKGREEFECVIENGPQGAVVRLCGELDLATLAEVDACVSELAARKHSYSLDLTGLTFIDSQGLALLVRMQRAADADGYRVTVVLGENPTVARAPEISGVAEILAVRPLRSPRWSR